MSRTPRLSIVASTDGSYEVVRRSVELLADQTCLDEIQMIIVGPSVADINPDMETLGKFADFKIVEFGAFETTGAALVAGLAHAKGEFLVFLEEHGFPPVDFGEKLMKTFDETKSDVVGYGLLPSNPGYVSWAHIYIQFGGAVPPRPSGYQARLGPHHVSYRCDMLRTYQEHLGDLLSNEAAFHELLRQDGRQLYFQGEIALLHGQISDLRQLIVHECLSGVTYGDARSKGQNWSILKRTAYVLGAPLIPFWRTGRAMVDMHKSGRLLKLFPLAPLIMLLVSSSGALGEAFGYIFGSRKWISDWRSGFELDRFAFVNEADQTSAPRSAAEARKLS